MQEVVWDWQKSCVHIAATFHSLTEYKDIRYTAIVLLIIGQGYTYFLSLVVIVNELQLQIHFNEWSFRLDQSWQTSNKIAKGQSISKWCFGVFDFFQKTNQNKSTWGIIVVKSNSFVHFLEESSAWKKTQRLCLTFTQPLLLDNPVQLKSWKSSKLIF